MSPTTENQAYEDPGFEGLVRTYYASLYRFAFSLTRSESDACDLTQQTFWIWGTKGHQLRDRSRVKSWLFTTLHREFLRLHRHRTRYPGVELSEVENELSIEDPDVAAELDLDAALRALARVGHAYQTVLTLFYIEDLSYREIGDILGVPIGTVQSRLSRGKAELRRILALETTASSKEAR